MFCGIGSFFTSLLGTCAGAAICGLAKMGNVKNWSSGKIMSFALMVYVIFLIVILRSTKPQNWLDNFVFKNMNDCSNEMTDDLKNSCYKNQISNRIALSGLTIYLLHFLSIFLGSSVALQILNSVWIGKFMCVPIFAFGFIFIPNSFFDSFSDVLSVLTIVFLVQQAVALIDFGYSWNELWVGNALEDQRTDVRNPNAGKKWYYGLIGASAIMCILSWVFYGLMFQKLGSVDSSLTAFLVSNLVATMILFGISITNWSKHGAMLPSAVVILFVTWLSWLSLQSTLSWGTYSTLRLIIGIIVGCFSMCYFSMTAKEAVLSNEAAETVEVEVEAQEPKLGEPPVFMIVYFNSMCICGLSYFVILFTRWNDVARNDPSYKLSFWVQAIGIWLLILLYSWTLIAPQLFPSRFD